MLDAVYRLLDSLSADERRLVFDRLRSEFSLHPLEEKLNTEAEVILEAIDRSGGLVLRMMRGVIAEAAFHVEVVQNLTTWNDTTSPGDLAYDFELSDGISPARVQVKLQRSIKGRPARGSDVLKRERLFDASAYIVETQRTRAGKKKGESTRPYRFGEFDLLAVSMYPSSGQWDQFMYTVGDWLLPQPNDPALMLVYQPVASIPNADWTDDFETCVRWWRSGVRKRIHAR